MKLAGNGGGRLRFSRGHHSRHRYAATTRGCDTAAATSAHLDYDRKFRTVDVVRLVNVLILSLCLVACGASITPLAPRVAVSPTRTPAISVASSARRHDQTDQPVRVVLASEQVVARLTASGAWNLYDRTSEHLLVRSESGDVWTVEQRDGMLRAVREDGPPTASFRGPLVARPVDERSVLSYNGHRYRGELLVLGGDNGLAVVNRLAVETYLRGVVPLEIGTDRTTMEEAAVEGIKPLQAHRVIPIRDWTTRGPYDMTATAIDQVYGGMDAERPLSDAAIDATRDLVLMYGGKVINAPYHANSGGVTAAASEVWRTQDDASRISYLVSDRIPGDDPLLL